MIDQSLILYQQYNGNFRDQVIDLLKEQGMTEEKFSWRYEKTPYSNESLLFLANYKGEIIGFRGLVRQKFKITDKIINVFSPCDAFVNKDFRRIGLMTSLNRFMIDKLNCDFGSDALILNLSSNENSTPGYLKQGWVPMNALKQYFHLVSFLGFFKYCLTRIGLHKNNQHFLSQKRVGEFSIQIHKPSESVFEDLVVANSALNYSRLTNLRDKEYYGWRYGFERDKYLIGILYKERRVQGYLILQQSTSFKYFVAESLFVNYHELKLLINFICSRFKIPYLALFSLTLSENEKKMWRKVGFFPEYLIIKKLFKKRRLPALIRLVEQEPVNDCCSKKVKQVRDYNNWNIHFADAH